MINHTLISDTNPEAAPLPSPIRPEWTPESMPTPLAFTVEEAAVALHVSTKTIRRLLSRGVLTSSKALRKKLIPRQQIENFLKATCDAPKKIV